MLKSTGRRRAARAVLVPALTLLAACGGATSTSSHGGTTASGASRTNQPSSGASSPGGPTSGTSSTDAVSAPGQSSDGSSGGDASGTGAGQGSGPSYTVMSVVDGDTIKVSIDGKKTPIRLIGVDTPETKKPHVAVQCYGKEASSHMQSLVQSRTVQLVADPSQGDTDKYGRLLRYVYVGSTNVALSQIEGGYGREYTYHAAYRYQSAFRKAQSDAQAAHRGTWGGTCNGFHSDDQGSQANRTGQSTASTSTPSRPVTSNPSASGTCTIKGNINAKGEKIAHVPGTRTYDRTKISGPGERMFCSVQEATAAGWRIAAD